MKKLPKNLIKLIFESSRPVRELRDKILWRHYDVIKVKTCSATVFRTVALSRWQIASQTLEILFITWTEEAF